MLHTVKKYHKGGFKVRQRVRLATCSRTRHNSPELTMRTVLDVLPVNAPWLCRQKPGNGQQGVSHDHMWSILSYNRYILHRCCESQNPIIIVLRSTMQPSLPEVRRAIVSSCKNKPVCPAAGFRTTHSTLGEQRAAESVEVVPAVYARRQKASRTEYQQVNTMSRVNKQTKHLNGCLPLRGCA